ncbi:magnesium and cobalt transport protein CorA [Helicobacter sp. 13S00401-1]|uniref:magnesium/cobalt transporter CorA n=1 Tax=Helicobacter sp. 13S00401-1 TaxID=1905758 RepID=UPI000BA74CFC|nr:magnesium/cobalt transporter CorA [Helicobacter sp. 13S00401-1]PAF47717.1 magnesium and cobalt transport protein CorA [Helicobacter sp. 13S00401-1]
MLKIYAKNNNLVNSRSFDIQKDELLPENILWIDLLFPTPQEVAYIAKTFNLDIPTKEEREEIELSARYWEDSTTITINTHVLAKAISPDSNSHELDSETITFMTFKNILFTIRYSKLKIFEEMQARVLASPKNFEDGFDVINKIYEVMVEKDADVLEWIDKEARKLRILILSESKYSHNEILGALSELQELNMRVRDSLFDKRRVLTALLKSDKIDRDIKDNLLIVVKDLNSIVEFNTSNLNFLDNNQNILSSQINIEQNKIIKIFTVATVAMMPPTLIGTIYGMNFVHMPELQYTYGYPIAVVVMIVSTILPILYFKKKGWL